MDAMGFGCGASDRKRSPDISLYRTSLNAKPRPICLQTRPRSVGPPFLQSFRGADRDARVGGEELLVLLPGATAEQAATVMTRFACTLAETVIDIGAHTLRVTATAGVVQQAGESLDALLARVDAVMYAGKQAGRNRVVLAAMPAVSDLSADAVAQIPCVLR